MAHRDALEIYRQSDIDWTYFSPAIFIEPGERTGKYRVGGDEVLMDSTGQSRISAEDYALAMLDDGLMQRFPFDEIYGLHNMPGLAVGRFETRAGAFMSAEALQLQCAYLLAHHYRNPATPVFRDANTNCFHLRRQMTEKHIRCGMKAQRGRDQIHQWWFGLQLDPGKIAEPREIAFLQMPANAQPVRGSLQREMNVFVCF